MPRRRSTARTSGDVGFYLRATATYNDGEGEGKSAMATSAHTVQAINLAEQPPPSSPTRIPTTPGHQLRNRDDEDGRGEHGLRVRTWELPVEADADDNDILTYTLGDTADDDGAFDIDAGHRADQDEGRSER